MGMRKRTDHPLVIKKKKKKKKKLNELSECMLYKMFCFFGKYLKFVKLSYTEYFPEALLAYFKVYKTFLKSLACLFYLALL